MDWTIVTSVLVALLLWVLALLVIAAGTVAVAFTLLRGHSERIAERMMDTCREHFDAMMQRSETRKAGDFAFNRPNHHRAAPCDDAMTGEEVHRVAR